MTKLSGAEWREVMERVGGFFRNTMRVSGRTCLYCTGPSTTDLCHRCASHRDQFGDQLADLVIPLTYAQGKQPKAMHQSAYTAYAYKNTPPAAQCVQDMQLMVNAATAIHGGCIAAIGGEWDSITFVPSTKRDLAPPDQPTAGLALMVRKNSEPRRRFVLERGPNLDGHPRDVLADRFTLPDQWLEWVAGKHVLVVDDTWTSGAKMQSATLTLKAAGARRVTALTVTRWTSWDRPDHEAFIKTLSTPYDPLVCPVHGGICTP